MDGLILNVEGHDYGKRVDLCIAIRDRGVDVHVATCTMVVATPELGMWQAARMGYKAVIFFDCGKRFVTARSVRPLGMAKTFRHEEIDAIADFICEINDHAD
jgi:hypothetical protein